MLSDNDFVYATSAISEILNVSLRVLSSILSGYRNFDQQNSMSLLPLTECTPCTVIEDVYLDVLQRPLHCCQDFELANN